MSFMYQKSGHCLSTTWVCATSNCMYYTLLSIKQEQNILYFVVSQCRDEEMHKFVMFSEGGGGGRDSSC